MPVRRRTPPDDLSRPLSSAHVQDSLAVIERGCEELLVEQEMAERLASRRPCA